MAEQIAFKTKFRAFQLDSPGSLFSYYKQGRYTLIEARIPKGGLGVLQTDLSYHNKERVDVLHITSWDSDHCTYDDLVQIINHLRPDRIEVPDYTPTTNDGQLCFNLVHKYDEIHQRKVQNVTVVNEAYISTLTTAQSKGTNDVVYRSMYNCDNKNNMSLIRLFRSEGFNVLSLGDCEAAEIADTLMKDTFIQEEVDVLILAHHGADNGFTTGKLIDVVNPRIAVCSSNYDNMFDHPTPAIRQLFSSRGIPLLTTKRGDVIIYQPAGVDKAITANLYADNQEIEETRNDFTPKRFGSGSLVEKILRESKW